MDKSCSERALLLRAQWRPREENMEEDQGIKTVVFKWRHSPVFARECQHQRAGSNQPLCLGVGVTKIR